MTEQDSPDKLSNYKLDHILHLLPYAITESHREGQDASGVVGVHSTPAELIDATSEPITYCFLHHILLQIAILPDHLGRSEDRYGLKVQSMILVHVHQKVWCHEAHNDVASLPGRVGQASN